MTDYGLYDVLAELGYGLSPRTRAERAAAFAYKHRAWLSGLPAQTAQTLQAMAAQFARSGADGLESPHIFQMLGINLAALKILGQPADILRETKVRLFAA